MSFFQRLLGAAPAPGAPPPEAVLARLDTIERRLANLTEMPPEDGLLGRLDAIERRLADPPADAVAAALREALAGLEKQLARAGREQLKANALVESQVEQQAASLEALRAAGERGEAELARLREERRAAEAAARLDVVRTIFPALDGLDEALRAGRTLLEQAGAAPRPATLFARLQAGRAAPTAAEIGLRESLAAWLVGLGFVRDRLLAVLAAEGVRPMTVLGRPFDSTRHVALEVVPARPDLPPGTVAAELRTGYLAGERVLRYAEVAVAKEME